MTVERPEDLAGFFNPDEFGSTAKLFPGSAQERDLVGLFETEWTGVDPDTGATISDRRPRFSCPATAVEDVKHDHLITVNAVKYRIVDIQGDAEIAVLVLARSKRSA